MLLQPSGDDLAGRYKTEDNFIMETDRRGRTQRSFHAGSRKRNFRGDGAA